MASANFPARLEELQSQPRADTYRQLLTEISAQSDINACAPAIASWIDSLLNSGLSIVDARPLLDLFVGSLKQLSTKIQIAVGRHAVDLLHSRVASYEEQDMALRELLAEAYTTNDEYIEAAKVLQGIQLESSQRKVSDIDKFKIWTRICRLYLEEDDTTTAETYLNRAKNLAYQVQDREAMLAFKLSQARISDSQRRFLEAGTVYHDISTVAQLADEERDLTLAKAITCAVLAPAGSQRTALLRKLHRDERARSLDEFSMLENMYLGRLITLEEVNKFAANLSPHQLAQTADGSTVLAKAVIEHNLLGISDLYESISATELGALLGLDSVRAEEYAARMIEQNRLAAEIDHVGGFIYFQSFSSNGQLCRLDERIRLLLEDVERVASLLLVG